MDHAVTRMSTAADQPSTLLYPAARLIGRNGNFSLHYRKWLLELADELVPADAG